MQSRRCGGPWVGLVSPNKFQALPNLNIKYFKLSGIYVKFSNVKHSCTNVQPTPYCKLSCDGSGRLLAKTAVSSVLVVFQGRVVKQICYREWCSHSNVGYWFKDEIGYSFTLCTAGSVQFSVVASTAACKRKSCIAILKKFRLKILFSFVSTFHPQFGKNGQKWLHFNKVKTGRPEDKTT